MNRSAKITEIFESIQGEGLYIGEKQIFVRFSGCNLNCSYCDTDTTNSKDYTVEELITELEKFNLKTVHSVSLTGGEPLLHHEFLSEFMPKFKQKYPEIKFYLETNATVSDNIDKIVEYSDVISADIKLKSSGENFDTMDLHEKFFKKVREYRVRCAMTKQYECADKNLFAKIVFDENITDDEIKKCCDLAEKYNFYLILQPKMNKLTPAVSPEVIQKTFDKFLAHYKNVRVIPQSHKLINVE